MHFVSNAYKPVSECLKNTPLDITSVTAGWTDLQVLNHMSDTKRLITATSPRINFIVVNTEQYFII